MPLLILIPMQAEEAVKVHGVSKRERVRTKPPMKTALEEQAHHSSVLEELTPLSTEN